MSPGAIPKRSIWLSWVVLLIVCALFGAAYAFNAPSSKELTFDVVCETFLAPGFLPLNLKQDPTELASVTGYDLDGAISGASSISLARDQQKAVPISSSTLTLRAEENRNRLRSYVSLTREGPIGSIALNIQPQVALSSRGSPGEAPMLALASRGKSDVALTMGLKQISVEGSRYTIPEVQAEQLEEFEATLKGRELIYVELRSGGRPAGTPIRLTFKTYQGDLPLLKSPQTFHKVSLSMSRAITPYLLLDNKSAEGVTADRKTDLTMDFESVTLDSIAIVGTAEKPESGTLHIKGKGKAKSVRQDGNQLLPTRLREILDKPLAERTGWLILLGAIAAVLLKAADHALEILLEWAIPKG